MGECVKSCCYCCASCYQTPICCLGSLCCLVVPLVGLLVILFGAVFGMMVGLSWLAQHHTEPASVSRMLSLLANSSTGETFTADDGRVIVE
uniref:Uncharacterized protein n=1 Tax=Anopheles dirus TaxID=7168 RepID=A0A182MXL4_9DIPT